MQALRRMHLQSTAFPSLRQLLRSSTTEAHPSSIDQTDYQTQRKPAYILPLYGASASELDTLSDDTTRKVLRTYGGLIRKTDTPQDWRDRLKNLTNASYRPGQLTIEGVVVSNKMDKSVVVAARRAAYAKRIQKSYFKTRRFMAHDEMNLCREGDRVVIKSCRLLSKRKSHVVVQNFGDATRPGVDDRKIVLEEIN